MKYEEVCWTLGVGCCKSNGMSNRHLSFIFILVHSITHKKILQFNELQDSSLSFIRLGWSWRDSNPRPNAELMSFLHAYLRFDCRVQTRPKPPICTLVSKFSSSARNWPLTISDIIAPPFRNASEQQQPGDVLSPQLLRRLS